MNQYSRRDMLRLGVSASAALAGSVFLPVRAQDNPLYEAARKEGALNLYWGSYEQKSIEDIRDAFVKKYPGIQVNLLRQGSQTVYTRLRLSCRTTPPTAIRWAPPICCTTPN